MDISALPATTSLASTTLRPASTEAGRRAHGRETRRDTERPHPERAAKHTAPTTTPLPRLPLVTATSRSQATPTPPGATFQARQASRLYAEVAQLAPAFDGELLGRIDLRA